MIFGILICNNVGLSCQAAAAAAGYVGALCDCRCQAAVAAAAAWYMAVVHEQIPSSKGEEVNLSTCYCCCNHVRLSFLTAAAAAAASASAAAAAAAACCRQWIKNSYPQAKVRNGY